MNTIRLTIDEANRLVRRSLGVRWFDVRATEFFNEAGETRPFLVNGHVKTYEQTALKRLSSRFQQHVLEACLNQLCWLNIIEEGEYIIGG